MAVVEPKYGSERTVFAPAALLDILSPHIAHRQISKLDKQLFTTPLERLWNRNNASDEWRRIRVVAGLPDDVRLHAPRRTYPSSLIASGCDVVTVQRALGHSQPSITLNVYAHLWPSAEDKTRAAAADLMASMMGFADSGRTETDKPSAAASASGS